MPRDLVPAKNLQSDPTLEVGLSDSFLLFCGWFRNRGIGRGLMCYAWLGRKSFLNGKMSFLLQSKSSFTLFAAELSFPKDPGTNSRKLPPAAFRAAWGASLKICEISYFQFLEANLASLK